MPVDVPDVSEIIVPQMSSFEEQYSQRNPIILTTTEDTRCMIARVHNIMDS